MELFVAAGAKYFVGQAAHHDNFHNWNSSHHPWNAVKMGPKQDIVAAWQRAAKRFDLPCGLSEHIGATFSWYTPTKRADSAGPYAGVLYDGSDPAYEDLYLPNQKAKDIREGEWYTSNTWWHERWFTYVREVIDLYQPDLLYSDGGVPFGQYGLEIIAHLYNTSASQHGGINQAVYNQKDKTPGVFEVGVFDIERSQQPEIFPYVWQTDTSVGDWFYNVRDVYKTPKQIAEILVDIVSKNGNLLLNIPQLPDGTIDDECTYLLEQTAAWMQANGEGIYGTRPWKVSSEGPSSVVIERFREDMVEWTVEDFRFTSKGQDVFAFLMKWPEGGRTVVRSFAAGAMSRVAAVTMLGTGPVPYEQTPRGLAVDLPMEKPTAYTQCLKVTFE